MRVSFKGGHFDLNDVWSINSAGIINPGSALISARGYFGNGIEDLATRVAAGNSAILATIGDLNSERPFVAEEKRADGGVHCVNYALYLPEDKLRLHPGRYMPTSRGELKEMCDDLSISLGDIDVSGITDLHGVFYGSKRRDFSGIEQWDVSNVTNMNDLFTYTCFNADLSGWNTSKVITMNQVFHDCNFNFDISGWDVSSVKCLFDFLPEGYCHDLSSWLSPGNPRALHLEGMVRDIVRNMEEDFIPGKGCSFRFPIKDLCDLLVAYMDNHSWVGDKGIISIPFGRVNREYLNRELGALFEGIDLEEVWKNL